MQVVGLVMVIALLSLPAATASHFSKRLWQMMVIASFLSLAYTVGGLYVSYAADMPTGATIIIVSGVVKQDEIDDLLAAGADEFVKKPFNIQRLLARIGELLEV